MLETDTWYDVVISGASVLNTTAYSVGCWMGAKTSQRADWDIDLIEIYEGTLSAAEVKILYDDSPIATNVTIAENDGYAAEFNGIDSKIDMGPDIIGANAVTIMGWIKAFDYGEGSNGYRGTIIDNGALRFFINNISDKFTVISDGNTSIYTGTDSFKVNEWQFVSVTIGTDGSTSFYLGDLNTAPALNGTLNQAGGIPVAGTTNIIIGNRSDSAKTFDGLIPKLKVVEGILSLDQITQYWAESLK